MASENNNLTQPISADTDFEFFYISLFTGVALGEACTIILRGATKQILDEAERSLHDALCVLSQTVKETRVVYGKL